MLSIRPLAPALSHPVGFEDASTLESSSSHAADKEIAPPSSPPEVASMSIPHFPAPPSMEIITLPEGSLPAPLLSIFTFVKKALTTQFFTSPPYTIQRLAELVLRPKQHYRFLQPYLNALDRVVSVSSGTNCFPLPSVELPMTPGTGFFVNGNVVSGPTNSLGSDEGLGGALLTPISWLRDGHQSDASTSSSVNGIVNSVEEGTDHVPDMSMEADLRQQGGVTQGELLRQEQEAADPPAPVASASSRHDTTAPVQAQVEGTMNHIIGSDVHDQPHARGPDLIGMEDTGKQEHAMGSGQVLDMEAAVGRPAHPPREDEQAQQGLTASAGANARSGTGTMEGAIDNDGDVQITDADGVEKGGEMKKDLEGDVIVPDA